MLLTAWHLAAAAASPGLRVLLHRRAAAGKEVRARLPERRGIEQVPRPRGRVLWLHAASVGEVQSILPVLQALDRRAPALHVLLTSGTTTSMRLLQGRLPALGLRHVLHRFVPWDVPAWGARFLDHWRPDAAAFVESEIWPNLLRSAQARGIPLALINARLSARSAARWARVPGVARQVLGLFDQVLAQDEADAVRLRSLGARQVSVPGNLKFAAAPLPVDQAELARLRRVLADAPTWLAASTHPGEEAVAATVHRRLLPAHPNLVTIIAPRHPERGVALAATLHAPRRAAGQDPRPGQPWLADTLGELGLLYRLAPIAFVGKSLVGHGCQNPLEPARLGCTVAVGPHTANFEAAVAALRTVGALAIVSDTDALGGWVDAMLRDPASRQQAGLAGQAAIVRAADLPDQVATKLLAMMPL